ncbi:MAG: hypothetical protein ABI461_00320 [Polyangiaceae bacterium]
MISVKVKRARIAIAIAVGSVMCVACVSVPDSIKTTFAPHQGTEVDNYAAGAPHSVTPAPDPELTQAIVNGPANDAGDDAATRAAHGSIEGVCVRDPNDTATDGGAVLASIPTTVKNCLQDAGNQ